MVCGICICGLAAARRLLSVLVKNASNFRTRYSGHEVIRSANFITNSSSVFMAIVLSCDFGFAFGKNQFNSTQSLGGNSMFHLINCGRTHLLPFCDWSHRDAFCVSLLIVLPSPE